MSEVTVESRIADPGIHPVLATVAALWGPLERILFQRLYRSGKPTKESIAAAKREFIARHGLTARQFNGMRMNLDGKVKAWRESRGELRNQLAEAIRKLQKRIGKLEKTREGLTRRMAGFKPSRKGATAQGCLDRRGRVAFQLHQKRRRLNALSTRLKAVEAGLEGPPAICFGGRKLFRKQFQLEANGFSSHEAWLAAWRERRSSQFFAVGSKGEACGNGECQFDPERGELRLRLPNALAGQAGRHLIVPVDFYREMDLLESLARGRSISYRFLRRENSEWYVLATTTRDPAPVVTRRDLGVVAADLNVDHIAVADLDRFGNLADHREVPLDAHGLGADQAKALIGAAVAELVLQARTARKPLAIEGLDFRKKKAALRELGKTFAKTLSGFAFSLFQEMVQSRCEREGVELIRVNPAFTSVIGFAKFSGYMIGSHVAAAMAIGRRGMGYGERLSARTASPRLGAALQARLREIAKGRQAGEHIWKAWKALTPWLRSELCRQHRPRSVQSGGASHPGEGLPLPATVHSFGHLGGRTPAALAVGAAAQETGQTKGPIDQHLY
jgi:IS605 OrfB family transposase